MRHFLWRTALRAVAASLAVTAWSASAANSLRQPVTAAHIIVGQAGPSAGQAVAATKGKRGTKSAQKLRSKKPGQPVEVRVIQPDGREQVFRGYAERGARNRSAGAARSSGSSTGASSGSSGDAPGPRVIRLRVPGG